ncbi:MAG: DUF2274 domain-containing protein [Xanthobacteraceae bacterium]
MARSGRATLPPIDVEDRSEKISLSLPADLRSEVERFGTFFAQASGQTPTSFNAILVGVIAGYLENHRGFRKWLKARGHAIDRASKVDQK